MSKQGRPEETIFRGSKYNFRLGRFVEAAHPDEVAFSWLSYDVARYYFDFVRNFLVVGALRYAFDKTGNPILLLMFFSSVIAFVIFVYSFFAWWDLRVLSYFFPKSGIAVVFDLL